MLSLLQIQSHPSLLFGVILLLGSFAVWSLRSRKRTPCPLPPGPPGEPFIGHFRLIPARNPEHKYIEWGKQYGNFTSWVRERSCVDIH
jgi:hypothetical protein